MHKTILYTRVSTSEQTSEHQLEHARKAGFKIDEVITDNGVSGVSTKLSERDGGKRLFDKLREGDTLVVRWVDRLGRNYADVTENIRHFIETGVTIKTVINGLIFDGAAKDPMQKAVRDALIGFMAAQAEAQAQATKEAQAAGIAYHKANSPKKFRGRKPSFTRDQLEAVKSLSDAGQGHSAIAKATGLNRNAVIRIAEDPVKAGASLDRWEPVKADSD